METINSMASAAAKAVWGPNGTPEQKHEPVSGVSGDTSKGEPFDAGNLDETKQAELAQPAANPAPASSPAPPAANPAPESSSAPPAPADTTSGQNDTRTPSDPATDVDPAQQRVGGDGTGPQSDGPNLQEPGPKPLATVAKEHGGDAGNSGRVDDDGLASSASSVSSSSASEAGEAGVDGQPPAHVAKKSHKKGTGVQYVKSSGLTANGGNFDASAPGAGREADRLLDQKGIHREGAPRKSTSSDKVDDVDGATDASGKKPSLKDKIKAKLHVH